MSQGGGALAGRLPDVETTERLGAALAGALAPDDVVFLAGPLGAGKSALARAIILARLTAEGRREDAPSPTYTLVQRYETRGGPILHADLYRLSAPEEAEELDLLDPEPGAVLLIEWADRLGPFAPERRLEIALGLPPVGEEGRLIEVRAVGDGWEAALAALKEAMSGATP